MAPVEQDPSTKYELRHQIGRGSFGSAFLVTNKQDKQEYVLKRVRLAKQTRWQRDSTLQERDLATSLRHPFIVPCLESWVVQHHTVNMIYAFCCNGDLASYLQKARKRGVQVEEGRMQKWLCQLLLALDYLQTQQVLHRDIKTSNLMLTADDDVQLGDFGLATLMEVDGAESKPQDSNLVGTPHYMSPELLSCKAYGFKTDVWSLGCVFYELTAQRPTFNAFNIHGLVGKIKRHKLAPLPAHYSADWRDIISLMLCKNPERRPSVQQLMGLPALRPAMLAARARARELRPDVALPPLLDPTPLSPLPPSLAPCGRAGSCSGSSSSRHRRSAAGEDDDDDDEPIGDDDGDDYDGTGSCSMLDGGGGVSGGGGMASGSDQFASGGAGRAPQRPRSEGGRGGSPAGRPSSCKGGGGGDSNSGSGSCWGSSALPEVTALPAAELAALWKAGQGCGGAHQQQQHQLDGPPADQLAGADAGGLQQPQQQQLEEELALQSEQPLSPPWMQLPLRGVASESGRRVAGRAATTTVASSCNGSHAGSSSSRRPRGTDSQPGSGGATPKGSAHAGALQCSPIAVIDGYKRISSSPRPALGHQASGRSTTPGRTPAAAAAGGAGSNTGSGSSSSSRKPSVTLAGAGSPVGAQAPDRQHPRPLSTSGGAARAAATPAAGAAAGSRRPALNLALPRHPSPRAASPWPGAGRRGVSPPKHASPRPPHPSSGCSGAALLGEAEVPLQRGATSNGSSRSSSSASRAGRAGAASGAATSKVDLYETLLARGVSPRGSKQEPAAAPAGVKAAAPSHRARCSGNVATVAAAATNPARRSTPLQRRSSEQGAGPRIAARGEAAAVQQQQQQQQQQPSWGSGSAAAGSASHSRANAEQQQQQQQQQQQPRRHASLEPTPRVSPRPGHLPSTAAAGVAADGSSRSASQQRRWTDSDSTSARQQHQHHQRHQQQHHNAVAGLSVKPHASCSSSGGGGGGSERRCASLSGGTAAAGQAQQQLLAPLFAHDLGGGDGGASSSCDDSTIKQLRFSTSGSPRGPLLQSPPPQAAAAGGALPPEAATVAAASPPASTSSPTAAAAAAAAPADAGAAGAVGPAAAATSASSQCQQQQQQRLELLESAMLVIGGLVARGRLTELASVLSSPGLLPEGLYPSLSAAATSSSSGGGGGSCGAAAAPGQQAGGGMLQLGDIVVLGRSRSIKGKISYIGPVAWDPTGADWVGMELDRPCGIDATQRGITYMAGTGPKCASFHKATELTSFSG